MPGTAYQGARRPLARKGRWAAAEEAGDGAEDGRRGGSRRGRGRSPPGRPGSRGRRSRGSPGRRRGPRAQRELVGLRVVDQIAGDEHASGRAALTERTAASRTWAESASWGRKVEEKGPPRLEEGDPRRRLLVAHVDVGDTARVASGGRRRAARARSVRSRSDSRARRQEPVAVGVAASLGRTSSRRTTACLGPPPPQAVTASAAQAPARRGATRVSSLAPERRATIAGP